MSTDLTTHPALETCARTSTKLTMFTVMLHRLSNIMVHGRCEVCQNHRPGRRFEHGTDILYVCIYCFHTWPNIVRSGPVIVLHKKDVVRALKLLLRHLINTLPCTELEHYKNIHVQSQGAPLTIPNVYYDSAGYIFMRPVDDYVLYNLSHIRLTTIQRRESITNMLTRSLPRAKNGRKRGHDGTPQRITLTPLPILPNTAWKLIYGFLGSVNFDAKTSWIFCKRFVRATDDLVFYNCSRNVEWLQTYTERILQRKLSMIVM